MRTKRTKASKAAPTRSRARSVKGLHLHFDPVSGIAGDMTVAALVDAGVPEEVVTGAVRAMKVPGLKVGFERRTRGAYAGRGFVVRWPEGGGDDHDHGHDHLLLGHHQHHEHRDYREIRRLLEKAAIPEDAKALALGIFARIAKVEAKLHGMAVDRVTFHEVGAYDSIADVVGAAAAIAWLEPASVSSTPPVVGTGTVGTAHGKVAVPAPATAALLEGVPVRAEGTGELTTPTGAAILAAVVQRFGALPPMRLRGQGFGAGTRELADRANVLRVTLGEPIGVALPDASAEVVLAQANLDDMSPQLVEPLMTALFAAGALDVWVTSILMKKGRPALEVSALAPPDHLGEVVRALFENSTTLGVRHTPFQRAVLPRSMATVRTRFGDVPVKVAALDGQVVRATPEFEDCRRLAGKAGVSVREVLAEASAAAAQLADRPQGR